MPYLIEFLLFLLPFAAYALWRRFNPGVDPRPVTLLLALAGVGLGLAGAVWYGVSTSLDAGSAYVPARLGAGGAVLPGQPGSGAAAPRVRQGGGQAEVQPGVQPGERSPERLR